MAQPGPMPQCGAAWGSVVRCYTARLGTTWHGQGHMHGHAQHSFVWLAGAQRRKCPDAARGR
eukprot:3742423-Alexandrium_andersonii.AAC.1